MNGLMFGEGTLEILPDGFGFLRSPDYHYLPCPDDIYVSPARFAGSACAPGRRWPARFVRPRKTNAISPCCGSKPSTAKIPNLLAEKVFFDDLTPLHPDRDGSSLPPIPTN